MLRFPKTSITKHLWDNKIKVALFASATIGYGIWAMQTETQREWFAFGAAWGLIVNLCMLGITEVVSLLPEDKKDDTGREGEGGL